MVPEKSSRDFQLFGEEILIDSHIHTLALFRPEIGVAEIREKQFVHAGRPEAGGIAGSKLGVGFLVVIPARQSIGGGIPEHIVTVVPDTGRREDMIPQVELCLRKPGMRTQDTIDESRIVLPLLFTKLITRAEQQEFRDLKVMLPFQTIGQDAGLVRRSERCTESTGDEVALEGPR